METRKSNLFFLVIIIILILGQLFLPFLFMLANVPQFLWSTYIEFGVLFIPAILYLVISKKSIKETLRLNPIGIKSILMIIVIGIIAQPLMMFLGTLSQLFFHNQVTDALNELNSLGYFAMIAMVALTPAICEETVMRGVVLSGYRKVDIKKAALMNGFLFGLFHLGPQQFLYAFALGVVFVYLVEITNSIYASMLCHFIVNGLQVTLSWGVFKFGPKTIEKTTEFADMPISTIISTLAVLFIVAALFTPLLVLVVKELDIENGGRLKKRKEAIASARDESIGNKVMNWPVYVTIALYFSFLALVNAITRGRV
ncbi:MAG: CPBP family intramembrane metalloprotease [Clostridiaceae bacterium]|nr:CPBP family intramembrane metalloprotease [Clostridiaceae bacterium]